MEFHQGCKSFGDRYLEPSGVYTKVVTKVAKASSLLMSVRAPVGTLNISVKDVCIGRGLAAFNVCDSLNRDYLYCYLLSAKDRLNKVAGAGTVFPSISRSQLVSFPVPLPPLTVQRAIVARLEKELGEADKLAAKFKRVAELADDAFKAELDETFKTLEDNSRRDAEMRRVRLGDVCAVQRGVRVTRKQLDDDGKYKVYQNSLKPLGKYCSFNCHANNPFMIMALAAGEVGFSEEPFWAADDCTYFKDLKRLSSKFLYFLLLMNKQELRRNVRQTTIPRLSNKFLEDLVIPLPDLATQRAIVVKLDAAKERCEKLKAAAMRGLAAAENLRKAILAEAFEQ